MDSFLTDIAEIHKHLNYVEQHPEAITEDVITALDLAHRNFEMDRLCADDNENEILLQVNKRIRKMCGYGFDEMEDKTSDGVYYYEGKITDIDFTTVNTAHFATLATRYAKRRVINTIDNPSEVDLQPIELRIDRDNDRFEIVFIDRNNPHLGRDSNGNEV